VTSWDVQLVGLCHANTTSWSTWTTTKSALRIMKTCTVIIHWFTTIKLTILQHILHKLPHKIEKWYKEYRIFLRYDLQCIQTTSPVYGFKQTLNTAGKTLLLSCISLRNFVLISRFQNKLHFESETTSTMAKTTCALQETTLQIFSKLDEREWERKVQRVIKNRQKPA